MFKVIYNNRHDDVNVLIGTVQKEKDIISLLVIAISDEKRKVRLELSVPRWYLTARRFLINKYGDVEISHNIFKQTSIIDLHLKKRPLGDYLGYAEYEIRPELLRYMLTSIPIITMILDAINGIKVEKVEIYENKMPPKSVADAVMSSFTESFAMIPKVIILFLLIIFGIITLYVLNKIS